MNEMQNNKLLYIIRKIIVVVAGIIVGLSMLVFQFASLGVHVFTVIIAFLYKGVVGAFITMMLPVISQIYWIWKSIVITGTFWNLYIIVILAYLSLWGLFLVSMYIVTNWRD